jgi:hypothetical protein
MERQFRTFRKQVSGRSARQTWVARTAGLRAPIAVVGRAVDALSLEIGEKRVRRDTLVEDPHRCWRVHSACG